MSEIPADLRRYLADADLDVIAWDAVTGDLTIRVTKEIGPEIGTLRFVDVSYLTIVPHLTVESITLGIIDQPPHGQVPDDEESIYWIHSSWGQDYCVIAKSIDYLADLPG
ncbi:hypothetical protein C5Y96_03940 [Blastopirellula marina]|uniref:Uncharacterized protein n=1 Tax=Blastopirellula marina TaxID=124 RepID=A0A2S8G3K5_9BACT|nr:MULTISPECIES: hypothetical protein [Pirellulaceae]PQO39026.1 hypothetical protein C5Y96_03940 [Blastopirellula marina]RCS55334.1 hypothetical protein DTL36_03945 [Bremerella cremea]